MHQQRPPVGHGLAAAARVDIGPGDGEHTIALDLQAWPAQRDFQAGGIGRISNQRVGNAQRHRIHRARAADANRCMPVATEILNAGQQARREDANTHRDSCANSSGSIVRNRTACPGDNNAGCARAASNSVNGVRPISCQPPGSSRG